MVPFSLADVTDVEVTASSVAFTWRGEHVDVPLGGAFNVINALAAATTAAGSASAIEAIVVGLARSARCPGGSSGSTAGDGRVGDRRHRRLRPHA